MLLKSLFLILSVISVSCGVSQPKPDLCSIVNLNTAQCEPTALDKQAYDKPVNEMLGFVCISPRDFGNLTKYIQEVLLELKPEKGSSLSPPTPSLVGID